MFRDIEKIKLISVTKQVSRHKAVHTSYPHRIILRLSAVMDYVVEGKVFRAEPGDVLFLPNSPSYQALYPTSQTGSTIMINFEGGLKAVPPKPLVIRKQGELHRIIMQMYRCWSVQTGVNYCRCMALLWELLAHFEEIGKGSGGYRAKILEPALEYLENHIFDSDFRVARLHTLCGISDTYFRKLFEERFMISPKGYVQNRRLDQAKAILDSGEYESIYEVAFSVGFEDSLYFGKAFKKRFGYSPSKREL